MRSLRHRSRIRLTTALSLVIFVLPALIASSAQDRPTVERKIKLPIADWISQGERQQIPWDVRITKPELTFQQRMLITVFAEVRSDYLQKRSVNRDLHFIVKVADESGKWLDEESYVPYKLTDKMDSRSDIQMETELYLKPGNYNLATIAYDSILGERSVRFTRIQIDGVERDPFPTLLSGVPPVQFLPSPNDGLVVFGGGHINLPVRSQRPVQFDLIVDLSAYESAAVVNQVPPPMFGAPRGFPRPGMVNLNRPKPKNDRAYLDRLIQSASVISQMHFEKGCTRVTAMDVLKRRIIVPTTAEEVNWQNVRKNVLGPDHNLVSVSDLGGKHEVPSFFAMELENVMKTEPQCAAESAKPVHVIAILAHGVEIGAGHSKTKVEKSCDCEVIYLKQDDNHGNSVDDLKGMLSPLSPKILEFRRPLEFRRKLADLVQAVEKAAAQ
jgi:hypothetical protein